MYRYLLPPEGERITRGSAGPVLACNFNLPRRPELELNMVDSQRRKERIEKEVRP